MRLQFEPIPENVRNVLDAPEKVVLYSVEPLWAKQNEFHGYKAIGSVEIDATQYTLIFNEIRSASKKWLDASTKTMAACFLPMQAIRVTSKKHIFDFLISYECQQIEIFENDKLVFNSGVYGDSTLLNSILTAANIPLAR